MNIQVLYEDNHLIAVNKRAGDLVHEDITEDSTLSDEVKFYIKHRYNKKGDVFLGVIHRLDRPVSGVIIFARTSKALERMNKLFKDRQIEKIYWAISNHRPEPLEGKLMHYLVKENDNNKVRAYERLSNRITEKNAKLAELDYKFMGQIGTNALIEVKPHTGRPHQIRVQLAALGCPIRGDKKYGFPTNNKDLSIHLHARKLSFIHPVKLEPVEIIAPLPDEQIWREFRGFDQ